MKKLSEHLNVNTMIKSVPFDDMNKIIEYVFKTKDYNFYLNSELIDVNNRFRIFKYKDKNYILKKTKIEDGNQEVELAKKAINILQNTYVDDYIIKIIEPSIYYLDNYAYILTEYMGNSLQECNYTSTKENPIKINTIFEILKIFFNKGILHRGFLPRNMIVNKNIIYLFDWEDAEFIQNAKTGVNLLWKTNFLLNWSYFYDCEVLEKELDKYYSLSNQEPPILKYEEKFKNMANLDYEIIELRKIILKTVLDSEKGIKDDSLDFVIPPNDMAHLVSDIFNSDIDVLFDISCVVLRKKSESKYIELLKKLSLTIVNSFYNNKNMQKDSIRVILDLMEEASKQNISDEKNILILFEKNREDFYIKLKKVLNNIFYDFNKNYYDEEIFERVFKYIYSFR